MSCKYFWVTSRDTQGQEVHVGEYYANVPIPEVSQNRQCPLCCTSPMMVHTVDDEDGFARLVQDYGRKLLAERVPSGTVLLGCTNPDCLVTFTIPPGGGP